MYLLGVLQHPRSKMIGRTIVALLNLFAVVANADVLLDIVAEVKNRERELSELLGCVHEDLLSSLGT